MAISVELKIDTTKVNSFLLGLPEEVLQRATARSLNQTMQVIRGITSIGISDRLKLKKAEINKGLEIYKKAKPSEPIEEQEVRMSVSSKPQSLFYFNPKQTSLGVTVNVKGQTKLVRHAFIATMPNGGAGVFIRRRVLTPGATVRRVGKNQSELPIKKLYTTRISESFTDQKGRYLTEGQTELNKQMKDNFDLYYNKYLNS